MKKILIALSIISSTALCGAPCKGIVFEDANGNSKYDHGEKLVAGVAISNADTVVKSDAKGEFVVDLNPDELLFPILPSYYKVAARKIASAAIKFAPIKSEKGSYRVEIPLIKQPIAKSFRIAAVGDIQVNNHSELSYAARTVFTELANRNDLDFYLHLGDMVNDNDSLFAPMAELVEKLPRQSWCVAGNHDRTSAKPRNAKSFEMMFGGDYAFNHGDVLFIMFNNVQSETNNTYHGGLNERQMRFLRNTLATAPKERLIVLGFHIPLSGLQNREQIITELSSHKNVLVLSAHAHQVIKNIHSPNICEQVVGAPCGMFWLGERGFDAVPMALQQCGSPRNYFTVDFSDGNYALTFKGIGLDSSYQGDVWIAGEEKIDSINTVLCKYQKEQIYANIFGGSDNATVRMRINKGKWIGMVKVDSQAPSSARIYDWVRKHNYTMALSRRQPMRSQKSPHLWSAPLPNEENLSQMLIEIEASDKYGLKISLSRIVNTY